MFFKFYKWILNVQIHFSSSYCRHRSGPPPCLAFTKNTIRMYIVDFHWTNFAVRTIGSLAFEACDSPCNEPRRLLSPLQGAFANQMNGWPVDDRCRLTKTATTKRETTNHDYKTALNFIFAICTFGFGNNRRNDDFDLSFSHFMASWPLAKAKHLNLSFYTSFGGENVLNWILHVANAITPMALLKWFINQTIEAIKQYTRINVNRTYRSMLWRPASSCECAYCSTHIDSLRKIGSSGIKW